MPSEHDEIEENDTKLIDDALAVLMKHFDTVHIFVTRDEPNQRTLAGAWGRGNWYARFGQIQEWLNNGGVMRVGSRACEAEDEDSEED